MVQTGPRRLEPRRIGLPRIGEDDGLLRVEACGICGSDCEQFDGLLPLRFPLVPGHEPLGIIERIGDRAAGRWGVSAGDRVVVEPILSCGGCRLCRQGKRHLCDWNGKGFRCYSYIPLEVPPGLWGGYAEYMYLAPQSVLRRIDPSVPTELAVLYNPLGAGFRWAIEVGGVGAGSSVVIIGPGQRGLACTIAAAQAGASQIIVAGLAKDASKLELARRYGATHTVDVQRDDLAQIVREATGGAGADVVIEASSYATAPVAESLRLVARGGTVVWAGVKGLKPVPEFVSDRAVLGEVTIRGTLGVTSSAFQSAIGLIEAGRVDLAPLATHRFALAEAETAIRTLKGEIEGEHAICCCLTP
ncbi:MAG: alcohol dehydrogenase [Deltaproteobacteria bacterium]|nr:MAG: alcohol dehydrogenase [Deltaproteobacteria bacterium]